MSLSGAEIRAINKHLGAGPQLCALPTTFCAKINNVYPVFTLFFAYPCARGIVRSKSKGIPLNFSSRFNYCNLPITRNAFTCDSCFDDTRNSEICMLDAAGDTYSIKHNHRNRFLPLCYCIPCHTIILAYKLLPPIQIRRSEEEIITAQPLLQESDEEST